MIVTGGASGIGAATVRRFLAEGAHVAVVDRNGPMLRTTVSEWQAGGLAARGMVTDVTQAAQVDAMVAERAVDVLRVSDTPQLPLPHGARGWVPTTWEGRTVDTAAVLSYCFKW